MTWKKAKQKANLVKLLGHLFSYLFGFITAVLHKVLYALCLFCKKVRILIHLTIWLI